MRRSRSKSRSPVRHHRSWRYRSRSLSPIRYRRDHRESSRSRDHHHHRSRIKERIDHYRDSHVNHRGYHGMREWERKKDHYPRFLRRSRSRSWSRSRTGRALQGNSRSPKNRKGRHPSQEVKREGFRSACQTMHSKSPSKDSKEDSLENDSSTYLTERSHKAEVRGTLKKSSQDVIEDENKKITSQGMSRGDRKSAHYSRHSNSRLKDSREARLENDMCTFLPEMREGYLEMIREDNLFTHHSKDSRECSLENDMGISPAQRRYKTEGGNTAKNNAWNAMDDKDNIKITQELKKEDQISADLSRHTRSISEDSRAGSLDKDLSISRAERRCIPRELERDNHNSTCNSRHLNSISEDFKEGSLEKDLSGCSTEMMDKVEGEDAIRKDATDIDEGKDNWGLGRSESQMKYLEHLNANQVIEKHSDYENIARENQEDKCTGDLAKLKTSWRKGKTMQDVMFDENIWEKINVSKYSSAGQRNFYSEDGETHEKNDVVVKKMQFKENVDDIDKFKEKKCRKNTKDVDSKTELREMIWQGKGNEVVEEGPELEEMMLCRKDKNLVEDEEEIHKQKKQFKKEREVNNKKKRKRHESRHRKEDGSEKHNKRRKKHKRHRSSSYSMELSSSDATERNDKRKRKHKRR